jgi:hypothetical protein
MDATPLSGDLRPMTPAETGTTLSSDATMPHSLYDPSAAMDRVDSYPIRAVPADRYNGSAIIPTGDPMRDALGPAAYANRHDVPDRTGARRRPRSSRCRARRATTSTAATPTRAACP